MSSANQWPSASAAFACMNSVKLSRAGGGGGGRALATALAGCAGGGGASTFFDTDAAAGGGLTSASCLGAARPDAFGRGFDALNSLANNFQRPMRMLSLLATTLCRRGIFGKTRGHARTHARGDDVERCGWINACVIRALRLRLLRYEDSRGHHGAPPTRYHAARSTLSSSPAHLKRLRVVAHDVVHRPSSAHASRSASGRADRKRPS